MTKKTFFSTGIGSGLGRALAEEALSVAPRVIGAVPQRNGSGRMRSSLCAKI